MLGGEAEMLFRKLAVECEFLRIDAAQKTMTRGK